MRYLLAIIALAACDQAAVEPIIVPAPDWCDDMPVTTWNNFGQGFLTENCQPCHSATSVDRHDAPKAITFDTPEQIMILRPRILEKATGADPEMPPAGGVSDEDRARLEVWLSCDFDPALD